VRRISGWIVVGSIAALVACWWGPLRFLLYAPPGYVPDGDALTISVWLGWLWIAIFVGAPFRALAGALAPAVGAICALLAGDVDFRRPRLRSVRPLQVIAQSSPSSSSPMWC
jgi:hypothetical protein